MAESCMACGYDKPKGAWIGDHPEHYICLDCRDARHRVDELREQLAQLRSEAHLPITCEADALHSRLSALERVLRDMLAFVGPSGDPTEEEARDPDFWEDSYKGRPSKEYLDYWKMVDAARALLPDSPVVEQQEGK